MDKAGDYGGLMGIDDAWAFNIIRKLGTYGESQERSVGMGGPLKLERGSNALRTSGGLIYAIPFR